MRRRRASSDDRLLARVQTPPDLREGVESLAYWLERRQRLPLYRIRARREAEEMVVRWEQRVRIAILSQPRVPIRTRTSAAVLLARTRLRRWNRLLGRASPSRSG